MARIPEEEIERLKREVSVERLVEASGVELTRTGANRVGRCPFHEDRTPSLVVTPAKNLWHCLGACRVGGGPIDWVMKTQGVSFRHAVELLREGAPSLAAGRIVRQSTVPKLPAPVALEADDRDLLRQVIAYYHETLKRTPAALEYLRGRGIDSMEAVEEFRLGFADRTLGLRLPDSNRKTGEAIRSRLQALGVIRPSGHEHFNGSLVVPVIDEAGNVTEIYGRKITPGLRPGTPRHLYLSGEARAGGRGVWNERAFRASKELIVCEALIDALTFWSAGYRNVTAAYGTNGFTEDHLAAMKRHGTERVLIAYDRDEAGDAAAAELAGRLMAEGLECWRIEFPKAMDANEYALKVKPATKSLGVAIRKAVWLGKGKAPSSPVTTAAMEPTRPSHARERAASSLAADLAAKDEAEATSMAPVSVTSVAPAQTASPVPPAPATDAEPEVKETEVVFTFGTGAEARRYRVRGLAKNTSLELLKVNVLLARGDAFFVDTLDLYSAKARSSYVAQGAIETGVAEEVLKADLGRVLMKLEALQEQTIQGALAPAPVDAAAKMTEPEHAAAMDLLRAPDLLSRIVADLSACGLVGEATNKLVAYLAAVSRKLDSPLAILVQSSSAAGKSSLMEAVLAMVPEEERVKYSAMTGQSLFYLGETDLKHKILAIAEEEGASRASYALKLLQSEGELTIASTGKDPQTGNLVTQAYRVEGPVMIMLTTTAIEVDEELLNRCLVLTVDENREQTRSIHRLQRAKRTLAGLAGKAARATILETHKNAQRLLKPLAVVNPYAERLTFADDRTRTRRDHEKYLSLIDAIALLHQHQREVKSFRRGERVIEYVEASIADIEAANTIAHEVLGRSLDELPPQTRRLFELVHGYVRERCERESIDRGACRFSRRELREAIGWGDTQLKVHLARLADLEYLVCHREPGAGFAYELAYDGDPAEDRPRLTGLIEVGRLRIHDYDAGRSGQDVPRSGSGRPPVGGRSAGGRAGEISNSRDGREACDDAVRSAPKTHVLGSAGKVVSYVQPLVEPLAAAASS